MKHLVYCLILLTVFASCKKKEITFDIEGVVTDKSFNSGLGDANYSIYSEPLGSSKAEVFASGKLDANGRFRSTIKRVVSSKIVIEITKNGYFPIIEKIPFDNFSSEETYKFNSSTSAKSWAKIHIQNEAPAEEFDHLRINKQEGKINCEECCSNDIVNLYGIIDTTFYCINDGNTNYSYMFRNMKTGAIEIKTINTTAFDTTTISFKY